MKTIEIEIKSAKRNLQNAITELKKLYNDDEISLYEMAEIWNYAKLLNNTDFIKTITD